MGLANGTGEHGVHQITTCLTKLINGLIFLRTGDLLHAFYHLTVYKMVQKLDLQENLDNFSNEIKSGVSALLHLMEDSAKENSLLPNGSSVFLQVSLFKVPEVEELVKRRM